ncbi:hypothetical protein JZ751_003722 [Albula glossodonta]|uniref:Uncharacterized protein n=1 Tax=Albula glossodonta TaxID=121402 RepID=A0A8T2P600_9TELE|nr:hypothetical protein JZ751_003722 [Albula glossodonta]
MHTLPSYLYFFAHFDNALPPLCLATYNHGPLQLSRPTCPLTQRVSTLLRAQESPTSASAFNSSQPVKSAGLGVMFILHLPPPATPISDGPGAILLFTSGSNCPLGVTVVAVRPGSALPRGVGVVAGLEKSGSSLQEYIPVQARRSLASGIQRLILRTDKAASCLGPEIQMGLRQYPNLSFCYTLLVRFSIPSIPKWTINGT